MTFNPLEIREKVESGRVKAFGGAVFVGRISKEGASWFRVLCESVGSMDLNL